MVSSCLKADVPADAAALASGDVRRVTRGVQRLRVLAVELLWAVGDLDRARPNDPPVLQFAEDLPVCGGGRVLGGRRFGCGGAPRDDRVFGQERSVRDRVGRI